MDSISFADRAYGMRRDGLASRWVTTEQKQAILARWPRLVVFGENSYYGFTSSSKWRDEGGYGNVRELMRSLLDDGYLLHANVLDLRMQNDANVWAAQPDLLQEWVRKGGYRLSPTSVTFEDTLASGGNMVIRSTWKNAGAGIFPNGMRAWNSRYKPAFALIRNGAALYPLLAVDTASADPGTWVKGREKAEGAESVVGCAVP